MGLSLTDSKQSKAIMFPSLSNYCNFEKSLDAVVYIVPVLGGLPSLELTLVLGALAQKI